MPRLSLKNYRGRRVSRHWYLTRIAPLISLALPMTYQFSHPLALTPQERDRLIRQGLIKPPTEEGLAKNIRHYVRKTGEILPSRAELRRQNRCDCGKPAIYYGPEIGFGHMCEQCDADHRRKYDRGPDPLPHFIPPSRAG